MRLKQVHTKPKVTNILIFSHKAAILPITVTYEKMQNIGFDKQVQNVGLDT